MASFAANPNLDLGRGIALTVRIETFFETRRMAFGAAGIPVLVGSSPMQPVIRRQVLIGIKVIPALPGYVPDDIKALQTPRLGLDQVLLQRSYSGNGVHRVIFDCPVSLGQAHKVSAIFDREIITHPVMFKASTVEIGQNGFWRNSRPGKRMMRPGPGL